MGGAEDEKQKRVHLRPERSSLQAAALGAAALDIVAEGRAEVLHLLLQHRQLPLDDQNVLQRKARKERDSSGAPSVT